MTPTYKDPAIEAFMQEMFGFDRREFILSDRCVPDPVGCGGPATKFRDEVSRAEYSNTGLCQACQDKVWPPSTPR